MNAPFRPTCLAAVASMEYGRRAGDSLPTGARHRAARARFRLGLAAALLLGCAGLAPAQPQRAGQLAAPEDPTPVRTLRSFDRREWRNLPQSSVTTLAQDDEGALWIGTLGGVATFDGKALVAVVPPGVPAFGDVRAIIRRRAGGVYVAGTDTVFVYDTRAWSVLPRREAVAGLVEAGTTLWAVTRAGELWRYPLDGPQPAAWVRPSGTRDSDPTVGIAADSGGTLLIATSRAVVRLDGIRLPVLSELPPDDRISSLLATRDRSTWVGTSGGEVWQLPAGADAWRRVHRARPDAGRIRCLTEDGRGRVWAGGAGGHLAYGAGLVPWNEWTPDNGLEDASILTLLADREGTVWIGYTGNGLHQLIDEAWSHRTVWRPLEQPNDTTLVDAITATADGGFLAAVVGKGIWKWDGRSMRQFGRADGLTEDVRFAIEPRPGTTWVGARYGLYESTGGSAFKSVLSVPTGFVLTVRRSPDGVWYAVSSADGIFQYQRGTWRPADGINARLPSGATRSMTWLTNGELWIATQNGLVVLRGAETDVIDGKILPAVRTGAYGVFERRPDEIWVAGDNGLGIRESGRWRTLTEVDGLPGRVVRTVAAAADGSVWIGTLNGVGRYQSGRWTLFDERNGLIDAECNLGGLVVQDDGSVFVGTMRSLARYDPRAAAPPRPPLRPHWLGLPAKAPSGTILLPSTQSSFALAWSAPWLRPEPVEFRFRVSDAGGMWSPPRREASVSMEGIGPGAHRAEVQARLVGGSDEDWSAPLTLDFYRTPRFSETVWPWMLGAAVAIATFWCAVRFRTRLYQRRQDELQRAVSDAVSQVKTLRGLVPVCSWCKKVRDDRGFWNQIELYVREHSEAEFSHGICPECFVQQCPEAADTTQRPEQT